MYIVHMVCNYPVAYVYNQYNPIKNHLSEQEPVTAWCEANLNGRTTHKSWFSYCLYLDKFQISCQNDLSAMGRCNHGQGQGGCTISINADLFSIWVVQDPFCGWYDILKKRVTVIQSFLYHLRPLAGHISVPKAPACFWWSLSVEDLRPVFMVSCH